MNNHVDHAQIQRVEGGRRSGPSPEKSQNIGFLSNTGPDLLEKHNASKPAFNVRPSSARQQMPFKRRFAGGPIMVPLLVAFGASLSSSTKKKKTLSELDPL